VKKIILSLLFITTMGSLAIASQSNINCVTDDGKFINLTVLIDGTVLSAQMEVISPYLYADKGTTSGPMSSNPTPRGGGNYWYSSNDNYGRFGYGMDISNQLIFSTNKNVEGKLYFGPVGNVVSPIPVRCNSEFEN
jgi:hypothetical protein